MRFAPLTFIKPEELKQLNARISSLELQVNAATEFVKEIEKGNWSAAYVLQSDTNEEANALQESLLSLRSQLQNYSLQEKERNWVTEGLAKFMDILRSKNEDIGELTDNIIRNLVKYLGANQGGLYLLNDDNPQDTFIEMTACYAYDRKKHLHQRIELGEGLAGQAVLEKDIIYMTDIPKSYVRITSGLGDASPSNLLIVPLKIEENVFGVVEVASFSKIQKYQIEFVQRLGESIASTLATVKTNQRTQKLLHETQSQTEQMRSQEEEMRQNMEELSATQEEMQRVLRDMQDKEVYLNNLLNASSDAIMTVDMDCKIVMYNKYFLETFTSNGVMIQKGAEVFTISNPKTVEEDKKIYAKVLTGETNVKKADYFGKLYEITTQPLRDSNQTVIGAMITARDISRDQLIQHQTEELLKAEKLKAEELEAREEEIHRVLKEVQEKERYLNELINVPKDSIFTVGKDYKIISYNKALAVGLEAMGIQELVGFDMLSLYPDAKEKEKQKKLMDRAFEGENFEITSEYEFDGVTSYYTINYAPLRNEKGDVFAIANFAKDTTSLVSAQKQAEKLLLEAKQQEEALRAQEEELRQNMEELSAIQEDMHRVVKEMQEKERYMDELINVTNDSIFTLDKNLRLLNFNKSIADALLASGITLKKGDDILATLDDKERERETKNYKRAFKGESFDVINEINVMGQKMFFAIHYAPLHDSEGQINSIAVFSKDVTAMHQPAVK